MSQPQTAKSEPRALENEPRRDTENRDSEGRFAKGNKGGPGNPYARLYARYRAAVLRCVTDNDLEDITHKLVELAKQGDVAAGRLILPYLLGKPPAAGDLDRLDIEEWNGFKETAMMSQEMPGLAITPSPELSLAVIRETRPQMMREFARTYMDIERFPEKYKEKAPELKMVKDPPSANGDGAATTIGDMNERLRQMCLVEPSTNGHK